jgi:uncharacterized protein YjbJ (UPF0337 family)
VGDRLDEAKGRVKESVGKATDNERLEGEGRTQATAAKAGRKVKGTAKGAGGRIKEAAGKLVHDEGLQARGRADRLGGDAERRG